MKGLRYKMVKVREVGNFFDHKSKIHICFGLSLQAISFKGGRDQMSPLFILRVLMSFLDFSSRIPGFCHRIVLSHQAYRVALLFSPPGTTPCQFVCWASFGPQQQSMLPLVSQRKWPHCYKLSRCSSNNWPCMSSTSGAMEHRCAVPAVCLSKSTSVSKALSRKVYALQHG